MSITGAFPLSYVHCVLKRSGGDGKIHDYLLLPSGWIVHNATGDKSKIGVYNPIDKTLTTPTGEVVNWKNARFVGEKRSDDLKKKTKAKERIKTTTKTRTKTKTEETTVTTKEETKEAEKEEAGKDEAEKDEAEKDEAEKDEAEKDEAEKDEAEKEDAETPLSHTDMYEMIKKEVDAEDRKDAEIAKEDTYLGEEAGDVSGLKGISDKVEEELLIEAKELVGKKPSEEERTTVAEDADENGKILCHAVTMYDFSGEGSDGKNLTIKAGDIIDVTEMENDDGWWHGSVNGGNWGAVSFFIIVIGLCFFSNCISVVPCAVVVVVDFILQETQI